MGLKVFLHQKWFGSMDRLLQMQTVYRTVWSPDFYVVMSHISATGELGDYSVIITNKKDV